MIYLENFTKILSKPIQLHKNIHPDNIRVVYGDLKRIYIFDVNDVMNTLRLRYNPFLNVEKTIFTDNSFRFLLYNLECSIYPYLDYQTEEFMRNDIEEILFRNHFQCDNYKKSAFIVKLNRENDEYFLTYFVNNKVLDNITQGKREPKSGLLTSLISMKEKLRKASQISDLLSSLIQPVKQTSTVLLHDEGLLKPNVSLFKYQSNDIVWMRELEEKVKTGNNIITHSYDIGINVMDDKFCLVNNTIFPSWTVQNLIRTNCIQYFGGSLVSEVGLGKTITSLYHIFSSQEGYRDKYSAFVHRSNTCNYFFKKGPKKGEACAKSVFDNGMFCKTHCKAPFIEKRSMFYKNLEDFQENDFIASSLYKTNASLIICPSHLCDQWVKEYYSKFNDNRRILLIVTKQQYQNLTFGDLLFADLVVTSYQFLTNSYFQNSLTMFTHTEKFANEFNESKSEYLSKLFNSRTTAFNLFKWDKIFLDEAHEIQNSSMMGTLMKTLDCLNRNFTWNITGTPFANGIDSFFNLMKYNTTYWVNNHDDLLSCGVNTALIDNCKYLFRRNTKESIKEEYSGNIVKTTLNLLTFTSQERAIYDSYIQNNSNKYNDFLIKLCCHSELYSQTRDLVQNCKTLDEIQNVMLEHNKKKLDSAKNQLIHVERLICAKQIQINEELDQELKYDLINDIGILKRKETMYKASIANIQRTYNYLEKAIHDIVDSCPICLDSIPKDQLALTKCGHKFCWDCIREHKNKCINFKCPSCNSLMTSSDIFLVTDTPTYLTELQEIIDRVKSTKIGNIIHYLKHNLEEDDKVIIFSQWDEMLHKVGENLFQQKLNVTYCNGSVYQRKKSIDCFSNDPKYNIIMLSSKHAASGINLTAANKIILLEPVYGTCEYRLNIENQIIGRANRIGQKRPIDIIRFIIKDTLEEDIINNTIDVKRLLS